LIRQPGIEIELKKYELRMITDPSHAWLEVPGSILKASGAAKKISCNSYTQEGMIYLDKDYDVLEFLSSCRGKNIQITILESHVSRSPIRGYPRYYSY